MIPALWVELDKLPTHEVSGKADLKNLPPPPKPATTTGKSEPAVEKDPIDVDAVAEV